MTEILRLTELTKSFGESPILRGLSLHLHAGEILALIGPSGSGKSTLLRLVNQLERADSGSIEVCGEHIVHEGRYADSRTLRRVGLKIGMVFQNFNLFPHFSVLKNITEAQIHVLKLPKAQAERQARDLLSRIRLEGREYAYPCELSGGQQQRVAIARSLALKPLLLCFDEPTSALDPELTGEIIALIRSLAGGEMAILIVTHEMTVARDLADRVAFMDSGLIVEEGEARKLIESPTHERTRAFLRRFSQQKAGS